MVASDSASAATGSAIVASDVRMRTRTRLASGCIRATTALMTSLRLTPGSTASGLTLSAFDRLETSSNRLRMRTPEPRMSKR